MKRVAISPDMLVWARERAHLALGDLLPRFSKLDEWESGETQPTLKQLERFARAVHVPLGYLFLPEPPEEQMPIPDFRTLDSRELRRPSPNLLDMLYNCQERQSWYRENARINQEQARPFVGSASLQMEPCTAADSIRNTLGFGLNERRACRTWEEALRLFIQTADQAGILVMVSGVVLSNNKRKLDLKEFRGFALSDPLAPLVFINGSDTKSGQMFTLAHELAHIWLNTSAVSNASAAPLHGFRREEVWCNAVAAELLVPLLELRPILLENEPLDQAMARLSRFFKVSTLVILRRLLDTNWLSQEEFDFAWTQERARLIALTEGGGGGGGGGDFYRTTVSRVSRRFTQALVVSTLEGQTLYRDAFRMLGVKKTETFNNLGREVGVLF